MDYVIKSSPVILYNFVSTPQGLAQWFADDVEMKKGDYFFHWEGYVEKANILIQDGDELFRFRLEDMDDEEYIEFKITKSEITGDTILIVTDFAEPDEIPIQKRVWDSQIDMLVSSVGGRN